MLDHLIRRLRAVPAWLYAPPVLLVATVAIWMHRLTGNASANNSNPYFGDFVGDLYREHYPMAWYGFRSMAQGGLPLWDPYQLCGLPFLAVPHTGLLYPGNLPYLFWGTGLATEIVLMGHLVFAALGMWLLAREFGMSRLGSFAAALTFAWSGHLMNSIHQSALISGMSWMPVTVLLVERTMRGGRLAPVGLAVACAFQFFNGATEVFVYNLYVAALFTIFRAAQLAFQGKWLESIGRSGFALLGVLAGVLLAAVQLVPTLELVSLSVRSGGGIASAYTSVGSIPPTNFLVAALQTRWMVAVGVLPLVGLGLGLGLWRLRFVWLIGVFLAVAAALLISNQDVYALYHRTPIGGLFRYPYKFLQVYAFAMALMGGLALTRLEAWSSLRRSELWRKPGWLMGFGLAVLALAWLGYMQVPHASSLASEWLNLKNGDLGSRVASPLEWDRFWSALNPYTTGLLLLLLVFGLAPSARVRSLVIVALLLLQGISLYQRPQWSYAFVRPLAWSEAFDTHRELLESLKDRAGDARVYISPALREIPGLIAKQGMLSGLRMVTDYEPLTPRSSATFFTYASQVPRIYPGIFPFPGFYKLGANSRWALMDLASTRYYVVRRDEPVEKFLYESAIWGRRDFRLVSRSDDVGVYERPNYMPRAYLVPGAQPAADDASILAKLASPEFDPRKEVILDARFLPESTPGKVAKGRAEIVTDEPEQVVIDVESDGPMYLVLTDTAYPGWRATVNGREVESFRANYLFRSVRIAAGRSRVEFVYRSESFRLGMAISVATLVLLVGLAFGSTSKWARRHRALSRLWPSRP